MKFRTRRYAKTRNIPQETLIHTANAGENEGAIRGSAFGFELGVVMFWIRSVGDRSRWEWSGKKIFLFFYIN